MLVNLKRIELQDGTVRAHRVAKIISNRILKHITIQKDTKIVKATTK
jgi:ribosomal protein L31E